MRFVDARGLSIQDAVSRFPRDRTALGRARAAVQGIVADVARDGDSAVLAWSEKLDGVRPSRLVLGPEDFRESLRRIPPELREALGFAARQIEAFHRPQVPVGYEIAAGPEGSRVGQQPRALDRVGIYVPGGPAGYPSSVLMGVLPAKLAGVREVLVATPPSRERGFPPDSVLAAAAIAGADEVLVAGGAQAVAAMAFGTSSVRRVDKIVGPGNLYVTAAKLLVADRVATDGIAGPSEVLVIADASLSMDALAAELLAQAEHDPDAVALAVLVDDRDPAGLREALDRQAARLPRGQETLAALERNGGLVRIRSVEQAIELANELAPEHLVLAVPEASAYLYAIHHAGCVFLGPAATAAMGDYTAGTNHVLPTAGSARWRGGLSVRDFVRFVSYVDAARADVRRFADPGMILAKAEGFEAHAAALASRIERQEAVPS